MMHHVQVGDLWEVDGRLFWIVSLCLDMREHSIYEYFEITVEKFCLERGHLTIQRNDLFQFGMLVTDYWKKVA